MSNTNKTKQNTNRSKPISEIKVLNAGLVSLMKVSGDDLTPVEAARTSYNDFVDEHTDSENENLVDFLIRQHHDGPLEFPDVTFYLKMPIFIANQLVRHRVGASINGLSYRYMTPIEEFYIPAVDECRLQSKSSKQGSSLTLVNDTQFVMNKFKSNGENSQRDYTELLDTGLAKELCRSVMPMGQYTIWYYKINMRALFHLLQLRLETTAQYQTQLYAQAMLDQVEPYFPNTIAAWKNHVLNALKFSQDEWNVLSRITMSENNIVTALNLAKTEGMRKTRLAEFEAKLRRL